MNEEQKIPVNPEPEFDLYSIPVGLFFIALPFLGTWFYTTQQTFRGSPESRALYSILSLINNGLVFITWLFLTLSLYKAYRYFFRKAKHRWASRFFFLLATALFLFILSDGMIDSPSEYLPLSIPLAVSFVAGLWPPRSFTWGR